MGEKLINMEKKNICRPIVLLNKQIPSTGKAITCDFVALGERDGIIIRDNFSDAIVV